MPDPVICNAAHPSLTGVKCYREVGVNAQTSPVYKLVSGVMTIVTPAKDVHVHKGRDAKSVAHRWEG